MITLPYISRRDTFRTFHYKGQAIHLHFEYCGSITREVIEALGRRWGSLKAAKRAISIYSQCK